MELRETKKFPCNRETQLDKLSSLPVHIIDQILSQLPIRDAVRTSVLSKKWQYKWATIPHLVFDDLCVPSTTSQDQTFMKNKLVNIVDRVLLLHNGPIVKFKLSPRKFSSVSDIDRWILHISRSSIKEFILDIWEGQHYKVPSTLFSCHNLIHLELFNCLLKPPSTFKGFRNLKSLDLQHITLSKDVFENLISSCPMLIMLTLEKFDGFTHLNIDAPNLQTFEFDGFFDDVNFENTFHLALVDISLCEDVKNDQAVCPGNSCKLLRFFVHLPHIRRLEVKRYFFKYLAIGDVPSRLSHPCVDLNYLSICINFNDLEENLAALCLLRSSPNLQELEMLARPEETGVGGVFTNFWEVDHWTAMFSQLRVVRIVGISGVRSELEFINFVLSNSPALERMTVKPASSEGECMLTKELLRFRRASVLAEIIYLDP